MQVPGSIKVGRDSKKSKTVPKYSNTTVSSDLANFLKSFHQSHNYNVSINWMSIFPWYATIS